MIMMYFTLRRCEEYFKTKYPEFLTLIIFNVLAVMLFAWIYGSYMILHTPFVFSLMYVWCKLEPEVPVSIWGFPVKSSNLPWVLLVLSILTGGDPF
jgi:derlin-1